MTYIANHSKETAMMKSMPSQCQKEKSIAKTNMGKTRGKKNKKKSHHQGIIH